MDNELKKCPYMLAGHEHDHLWCRWLGTRMCQAIRRHSADYREHFVIEAFFFSEFLLLLEILKKFSTIRRHFPKRLTRSRETLTPQGSTSKFWNPLTCLPVQRFECRCHTCVEPELGHDCACISITTITKCGGEIIYPLPNFNGCTIEVWEWIGNFIPHLLLNIFISSLLTNTDMFIKQ